MPGTAYGQTVLRLYETALEFAVKEFPSEPLPENIIDMLSGKVSVASPDYWVNVLKGIEQVNIRFSNTLLARLAGFNV